VSKRRKRGSLSVNPGEWAPLKDAHAHIKTCVGSGLLAARRLLRDLIDGQIASAYCHIAPDGTETCGPLKPSSWKEWYVDGAFDGATHAWGMPRDLSTKGGRWFFFVRRADLDKHYPREMPVPATPATVQVHDPSAAAQSSSRRKPGPKIKKDWRLYVAAETYRIRENENRTPSAGELALLCEEKLEYQPDTSDIQKLLRMLLGD
jgi:hypothetical protein